MNFECTIGDPMATEQPVMEFASEAAFAAWLEDNHAASDGIWLKYAKKGTGVPTIVYAEALEVALCFGWIDGQVKKVDDVYYMQRWTPRRARSKWSKRNCGKAEELIASGAMRPAGLAEVERAKRDGRWEAAYDAPSTASVPDDLQAELDKDPKAAESFATLSSQNRYAILYRLQDAKKPETRARRLAQFMDMLRRGDSLH
jgi:uncharacterized protein YdeI (YjbR/CyaY-like superfamily)